MKKHSNLSDIEKTILNEVQSGVTVTDAVKPMIKRIMEAALEAEMNLHMEEEHEKWNMPVANWGLIASQLDIHFPNRNLIDLT